MLAAGAVENFIKLGRVFFPDEVMLAKSLAAVSLTNSPFPNPGASAAECKKNGTAVIKKIISSAPDGFMSPESVRQFLYSAGVPHVRELSIDNMDEIEFAAAALGLPLAMKVSGPVHKSDVAGVKLNISSAEDAKKTYSELMTISGAEGVIMQQMTRGIELFIGAKREPGYGHIILCGLGGIFVETLKDISAGIVPVGWMKLLT
jgi:acetyltransferase